MTDKIEICGARVKGQSRSVFIYDEPTIGLHPLDVQTLLNVFQILIKSGATVIVIEYDLDVIRSADYIIDMSSRWRKSGRSHRSYRNAGGDPWYVGDHNMEIYLITEGVCLAITEDGNKLWKLLCHNSFKKISFL